MKQFATAVQIENSVYEYVGKTNDGKTFVIYVEKVRNKPEKLLLKSPESESEITMVKNQLEKI